MKSELRVLLVEDNPGDARLVQMALSGSSSIEATVDEAGWLSTALTLASNRKYDIVMLDLSLPDSSGVDTLVSFMTANPSAAVIVMTGNDDMEVAIQCVRYGAQDYVLKDSMRPLTLVRSILYAVERNRVQAVSRSLTRQSLSQISSSSGVAVKEHMVAIQSAIADVEVFLGKNAPAVLPDVVKIFDRHNVHVAIRSALEQSEADESKADSRKPKSARAMVLDAITKLDDKPRTK